MSDVLGYRLECRSSATLGSPKAKRWFAREGDGKHDLTDVPRHIDRCHDEGYEKLIFAERAKRSESLPFKLFYLAYRRLYRLLTGHEIRVSNFSVVPRRGSPATAWRGL